MRGYTNLHSRYYLPEDEDSIWPREEYLRQLNNVV